LIVSCQASEGEPLCSPEHIKALALSALNGGAGGLRLEGEDNIRVLREATQLPIVGLIKSAHVKESERLHKVYITSTFEEALAVARAGADIIALDATNRPRPEPVTLQDFIARIKNELGKPVWADVSTLSEGHAALAAGADVVSTTMYGYTAETRAPADKGPDMQLLANLCNQLTVPVILEGRVWHPEEVSQAFELGAFAVVVGSAITRPQLITKRFTQACPQEG
jgi:putative N-acetylmannosamine-6-phosphate epimerase